MTDHQTLLLLLDVALIIGVASLAGLAARALRQPVVLGEIVAGILLGPTLFGGWIARTLFPADVRPLLGGAADLALSLFMFVVGMEFELSRLRGSGRIATSTALGSALVPLAGGSLLALYLLRHHETTSRPAFVLFVGVVTAITAFPVLARIIAGTLKDTLVGAIALSAAAVCDLAVWSLLAVAQIIAGGSRHAGPLLLVVIPYVTVMIFVVRPLLKRLLRAGPAHRSFVIIFAGLLTSAALTQLAGLHFVFGAFLFGLVVPRTPDRKLRDELVSRAESTAAVLLPVYFVIAGLNVDLSKIDTTGLIDLALILAVAVTGKLAGTFLGAKTQGLNCHQSAVLGVLMNTRGLTELIVLGTGLRIGILDHGLYTLLVLMAVLTTLMTGPLLHWLHRRAPEPPVGIGATSPQPDVIPARSSPDSPSPT